MASETENELVRDGRGMAAASGHRSLRRGGRLECAGGRASWSGRCSSCAGGFCSRLEFEVEVEVGKSAKVGKSAGSARA